MDTIKQAIQFHKKGQYDKAKDMYMLYLKENPLEANAHHLLGLLGIQSKNLELAYNHLYQAFLITPSSLFEGDLALYFYLIKDYKNALMHFTNSLEKDFNKDYIEKAVECARYIKNYDTLLFLYEKMYENDPENISLVRELPDIAEKAGNTYKAIHYLNKCIEIKKDDYIAYNNLGLLYENAHLYDEAKKAYEKSIELCANYHAYFNLGVLERTLRNLDESEKCLRTALELNPDAHGVKYALGMTLLCKENFKEGYPLYLNHVHRSLSFIKQFWDGREYKDSKLVVYFFGGFGDIFMFTRYADYIKDKFKDVTFLVPDELLRFYAYNFPQYNIVSDGSAVQYNYVTTFQDLVQLFDADFIEHIPHKEGYLKAPPLFDYALKTKLTCPDKKKVGIFYKGNNNNKRTLANRSIPLELLNEIFDIDNIQFYSLQIDDEAVKKYENVIDLSENIDDFHTTASIINDLDAIISIDSSPLHLAGALNKKAYLLLPYGSEWRWFNDTDKCRWYNSVTIIKQPKEGDWESVVSTLKDELCKSMLQSDVDA